MDGTPQPQHNPSIEKARRSTYFARTVRERVGLGLAALCTTLAVAGVWVGVAASNDGVETVASQDASGDDFEQWAQSLDPQAQQWLQQMYEEFESFAGGQGGSDGYGQQLPGQQISPGQGSGSTQEDATAASASESTGVVIINTELGYGSGEAAGTGMILTADGYVLTNHHVIADSTEITVTDPSTGKTYTATLVGSDATHDVALLKLEDASGLTPITVDEDDTEAVGDAITAVGNASGGGVLMAADGTITGLDATVTTNTTTFEQGETLTGTIEIQADVVSGDSGGALLDADGEVIGMNTAASSGGTTTTAYAITIEDALAIVDQIRAGDESGTVTLGYPAFLGIGLSNTANSWSQATTDGATVGMVYDGTPAAKAGLEAGDVITKVDGTSVTQDTIAATLKSHDPGDKVKITWTDTDGGSHSATVTLAEGPAA